METTARTASAQCIEFRIDAKKCKLILHPKKKIEEKQPEVKTKYVSMKSHDFPRIPLEGLIFVTENSEM